MNSRPVEVLLPPKYSADKPAPLVVLMHGYGGNWPDEDSYLRLGNVLAEAGFIRVIPTANVNATGRTYWNATAGCCAGTEEPVDDSAYLRQVIEDVRTDHSVDPNAVFVFGVSNGGFMAHRFACDHADVLTGAVSFLGAAPHPTADAKCVPSRPVSILQISGDADTTITYDGGAGMSGMYPGAFDTVAGWVTRNGCSATKPATRKLDLALRSQAWTKSSPELPGSETVVTSYRTGCRDASVVELWTMVGADHGPSTTPEFATSVRDFMLAHRKK